MIYKTLGKGAEQIPVLWVRQPEGKAAACWCAGEPFICAGDSEVLQAYQSGFVKSELCCKIQSVQPAGHHTCMPPEEALTCHVGTLMNTESVLVR